MPTSGKAVRLYQGRPGLPSPGLLGPALPSPGAPEAFTWPQVHAHWAQSGPPARSVFSSRAQGLLRVVGEAPDRCPSAMELRAGSVDPKA